MLCIAQVFRRRQAPLIGPRSRADLRFNWDSAVLVTYDNTEVLGSATTPRPEAVDSRSRPVAEQQEWDAPKTNRPSEGSHPPEGHTSPCTRHSSCRLSPARRPWPSSLACPPSI